MLINNVILFTLYNIGKDFSKERYNTLAISCTYILYTKTDSAINIWSIFGTMCCL